MSDSDHCEILAMYNQNHIGNLTGVLHGLSNLLTFPCKIDEQGTVQTSIPSKEGINLVNLRKDSWLYGKFQRRLINETSVTFTSLQNLVPNMNDTNLKPLLVKKSKEYRSVIQATISEINHHIDLMERKSSHSAEEVDLWRANCQLLYKMELILALVEIIFIEPQPGNCILNSLMNWVRLHFPESRRKFSEALSADKTFEYKSYWDTCYGLILQGMLEEARTLLSHHPECHSDSFLSMDELLRKMPVYHPYSGVSEAEFVLRWQHWQNECTNRLEKGDFLHYEQLQTICKILCGDVETLLSLADILETWYNFMTSLLYYSIPLAKVHYLATTASDALSTFRVNVTYMDELILAIFQINDHLVLKECHSVLGNVWFSLHISDLLYHSVGKNADKKYLENIRENFLLDYGCELTAHRSLWQVGLIYLDATGPGCAEHYLKAVLERIPVSTDAKAFKVIQEATKRGLDSVAKGVCRVMGRQRLRDGQLGSAIWWGIRSQDSAFTSHLAHKVLQNYMENGKFLSSSLLDHLGPAMHLSDALTFLSKYREFHLLYESGEIKDAADLLISLVASQLTPEYFWPVLLEDALPLLQSPIPVFSSDQTYKLMYCLHTITVNQVDSENEESKKQKLYTNFLEKEARVRSALTANLSRAIIHEGTVDL